MKSAKVKTVYVCQGCGTSSPKWLGRCSGCGEWNTLVEEKVSSAVSSHRSTGLATGQSQRPVFANLAAHSVEMTSAAQSRLLTGVGELDRVLGGGLVPDSFVLLGGDPGIGKSTLLLQVAQALSTEHRVLYVSGEESLDQVSARARRLGFPGKAENIFLASETELEKVLELVSEVRPQVLVVDSLQTVSSSSLESAPGSVSQLREVAARLMRLAKSERIAVWLVGHVTKDGSIAGPKVVEHMVDTVLYFEGEGSQNYRMLRAVKNRFGSVRELGVFEMTSSGLGEVKNPSSLFLSERKTAVAGVAIAASIEGTRPILTELQALVSPSVLAMPRRTAVGMDSNRVALLAAILERHLGLPLGQRDLFFNVVGGLRLSEPACDLAGVAAIWSSFKDAPVPASWVWMGEVGLTGEVRRVSQIEARVEEAVKLGFGGVVIPESLLARLSGGLARKIKILGIERIHQLGGVLERISTSG